MKKIIASFFTLSLLLSGCSNAKENEVDAKEDEKVILGAGNIKLQAENFVRVQDYTGEGFALRNSHRTKDIIKGKEEEIEEAVVQFFQTKYKTDIKVHAIHPAVDGAAVYVESIGAPHFYTFAVVPIDVRKKLLKTDNVFTQEGEVERAIVTAMYAMMYDEKFANLDAYLEKLVAEHPLTGLRMEAVERVGGNRYSTPYYFVETAEINKEEPINLYLQNPDITKEEIKTMLSDYFKPEKTTIAMTLYMSEDDQDPDEALYDKIISDIKMLNNIPPGSYGLILHDNLINAKVANGSKASSINKTAMNKLLKK